MMDVIEDFDAADKRKGDDVLAQAQKDAEKGPGKNVESVADLVKKQIGLEDRIAKGEALLKTLNSELAEVMEQKLPDAMLEAGISRFDTDGGDVVKVEQHYYASVTKANHEAFLDWLEKEGHDGMVDASVMIKFGKGEYPQAKEFCETLRKSSIGNQLPQEPTAEGTIHWATLRAFAREQTEEGNELFEDMNVHYVNRAKIERAKP